ncbi:ExbD/TolR family protein [Anaeromyxobacter oryzae]|uniref:Biopolymer transporter ExbD n=1 Tax=Anaeromyxobacter oryzae TaxID=2918170 RepID=A0ABM7WW16_9BACT|nr:biopolymer transporter ExbD [Anaeromyxobacter oryzae]BDG03702.1 biopolymer transporter ExbD [Anaeromyxobacter oryzae]
MAGTNGGDDDDLISGINVTPLVDIVLVLLIIFMVTASYIVRAAIRVELPRVAHGGESAGTLLTVVLAKDGTTYLDGVRLTDEELVRRTRDAVAKDQDARVLISADKGALHGSVVHVLDLVRGAGATRFAIHVERER